MILFQMSVVDVFISNYPVINWDLYDLWVEGYTEREALAAISPAAGSAVQLVDLHDNFRTFSLWETMLHQPIMFSSQSVFQLDCDTQNILIEKYYALDSAVIRELLGKKFSNRLRKDLDEVSEKSKVSLRSCRRQFDNIKRVFRTIEEMPGNFLKNIKTSFLLPSSLAEKYSIVVFLACHRFEVAKKKLNYLSFEDFSVVCKTVMKNWTYNEVDVDDNGDPSLDRDFFYSLRDLKSLLDKEKDHRYTVCQTLGKNNMKQRLNIAHLSLKYNLIFQVFIRDRSQF